MNYLIDNNIVSRLNQVTIKHSHIISSIKTYETRGFNNFDSPLCPGSKLALRKLIMGTEEEDGEIFSVTTTRDW